MCVCVRARERMCVCEELYSLDLSRWGGEGDVCEDYVQVHFVLFAVSFTVKKKPSCFTFGVLFGAIWFSG